MTELNGVMSIIVLEGGAVIPFHTLEVDEDPIKHSVLPDLPDLPVTEWSEEERRKETKLIKIAAYSCYLPGLTNKGHVLQTEELHAEEYISIWNYVSESPRTIWHHFLNRDT